jgi:hypothetical protein
MSTVRVLNPLGIVPGAQEGAAAVVTDLAGKRIVILENGKQNARELLTGIAERLQQRYPGLSYDIRRKQSASLPADPDLLAEIRMQADVVLTGSGD